MASPIREQFSPLLDPIEGLSVDPDRHRPPGDTTSTARELGQAAVAVAYAQDIPDITLGTPMMTHGKGIESKRAGVLEAEREAEVAIKAQIGEDLRPLTGTPYPLSTKAQADINKLNSNIAEIEAPLPAMEARLQAMKNEAALTGSITRNQGILATNIAGIKRKIAEAKAKIAEVERADQPATDPFTRAKLAQEINHRPTTGEARAWSRQGEKGLRSIVYGRREAKRVSGERGITEREQRQADRARRRLGLEPIHGTGLERPVLDAIFGKGYEVDKADKESESTSYNQIARKANVIQRANGEFVFVQDVSNEGAQYSRPDGTKDCIYFLDPKTRKPLKDSSGIPLPPIQMDDAGNLQLRGPSTSLMVGTLNPSDPLGGEGDLIDLSSPQVRASIHQGEEFVTLGRLFSPEDATDILEHGASGDELSPIQVRLDDLVFEIFQKDSHGRILKEEDRQEMLKNYLTWQNTATEDPMGRRVQTVGAIQAGVPIFDGHNGHFVRALSYPEQRQESLLRQANEARTLAAKVARTQDLGGKRPPRRRTHRWS